MNSYRRRRCGKYALQGAVQSHHFEVRTWTWPNSEYLRVNEVDIISRLGEALRVHQSIKWYATMDVAFYRTTPDGEIQNTTGRFRTQRAVTSDSSELSVDRMIDDFLHAIEAFNRLGSQWKVDYIIDFSVTLAPFRPAQRSSCIPTPTHIAAKKCVVNVQNRNDELCFLYSILAHIHRVEPKQNQSRVCHYRPHLSELDTTGLTFPLPVSDVVNFERLNEDIAVNVITFDERQPILLYVTPHRRRNTSSICCC